MSFKARQANGRTAIRVRIGKVAISVGFGERQLNDLLSRGKGLTGFDQVPSRQKQALSGPGDIWLLGKHRLLCGDATRKDEVLRLPDGPSCDLVSGDSPYNVAYCGRNRKKVRLVNDMALTAGWDLEILGLELEALVSETADEVMPELA